MWPSLLGISTRKYMSPLTKVNQILRFQGLQSYSEDSCYIKLCIPFSRSPKEVTISIFCWFVAWEHSSLGSKLGQLNQGLHSLLIVRIGLNSVTLTAHSCHTWARQFLGLAHSPWSIVWAFLWMTQNKAGLDPSNQWRVS